LFLVFVVLLSALFSACAETASEITIDYAETTKQMNYKKYEGTELSVYNWGYYISDGSDGSIDVNEEFEKLTGIRIVYDNYDSNESLYAKLDGGGADYDVVIPSDYMIGRLIKEGYLAELNFENIPNYKYIDEKYKNTKYDPENKYSVPYNVGMVGVIYNTTVVEGTPDSWDLMWDERYKGKILNFNNSRDAFAISQFYQGIDINTEDEADWDRAYDALAKQKSLLQSYVMDEVFNKMESGEAAVAPYYAGDFFTMYGNNEDLAFYYPKEGTNQFIDAACVLKNSKNKEAAELYINFLLDPEIARANAEYMYYASPNTAVVENEEYIAFLEELHPDAYSILYESGLDVPTDAFVNLSDETKAYMAQKWTKLGATSTEEADANRTVYIICIVIIVFLIIIFSANKIMKIRREMEYNR
jgi:spermidine/putrescine transport system substrate-binding protein